MCLTLHPAYVDPIDKNALSPHALKKYFSQPIAFSFRILL